MKIKDWNLGKDLAPKRGNKTDYSTISGLDNLAQAIKIRLLAARGSYTRLGHPSFGSRLHELVGELNNEINLKLAEHFVKEALTMEKRIKAINKVKAEKNSHNREIIDIRINVSVSESPGELNLVVPFYWGA